MTESKLEHSLLMPRRTFLASASFGMFAGMGNRQLFNGQNRTAKAVEALSALVSRKDGYFNGDFKVDSLIRAAVELQALEKIEAMSFFLTFAKESYKNHLFESELALIALCRMLFTQRKPSAKKAKSEFRRARIGGPGFLGDTDYDDWSLEPIEIIDGIPFLIVQGYILAGFAEPADRYIEYCIGNCDWNDYRFRVATMVQKQSALEKLLASPKWKQKLSNYDKEFFSAQIQ